MEKLVLIDGNAIIHRAYHSMPKGLATRSGELTNAVYGFAVTLIKVLEDLKPDYICASFDLAGPTFRHEVFKEYKATRVKADQELYDQIPRVKKLVETMGIPIYEKSGFEADDTIGTIVRKIQETRNKKQTNSKSEKLTAYSLPLTTYIVSGDKDIFQLVDDNVKVYNLKKGLTQTQIVDAEIIQKEYNLQPSDFIDLKALAGDPSDNIPGVPGIGQKTATELLQKFDTLEKLYEAIDKSEIRNPKSETNSNDENSKFKTIKPRILELLKKHKEQAFLSQHLATIHTDVPIDFDLEKCRFGDYDKEKLRALFEELGFASLLRRFDSTDEKSHSARLRSGELRQASRDEQSTKDQQLKLL